MAYFIIIHLLTLISVIRIHMESRCEGLVSTRLFHDQ